MSGLILFVATVAIWATMVLLWIVGWFILLLLWLYFGPQDVFGPLWIEMSMNISLIAMTGFIALIGGLATRAAFRRLV